MPERDSAVWTLGTGRLRLTLGDITLTHADALVNAANARLAGGGGVDGAIQRAAGPELLEAGQAVVRERGPLEAGQAVATPGFRLRARHVIHTVGPIWRGGDSGEQEALAAAYRESLRLARELQCASVAFPAVSTGAYGYPLDRAMPVALAELRRGAEELGLDVTLYLHGANAWSRWLDAARSLLGEPEA